MPSPSTCCSSATKPRLVNISTGLSTSRVYPIGSNGASQAILDAEALGPALASGDVPEGLARYADARREPTGRIILANRGNGPEQVMQLAHERAPDGFADIEDVIPRAELEEIAARYKRLAGFAPEQVNR